MKLTTRELTVFAMLGAVMYASKVILEFAPNIHLLGVFTIAFVMLLPKKMPRLIQPIVYMAVCAVHGFLFGTLYAPVQAVLFGLSLEGMAAWIVAGLPWDFLHGVSNFFCGVLIMPIVSVLRLAERYAQKSE